MVLYYLLFKQLVDLRCQCASKMCRWNGKAVLLLATDVWRDGHPFLVHKYLVIIPVQFVAQGQIVRRVREKKAVNGIVLWAAAS